MNRENDLLDVTNTPITASIRILLVDNHPVMRTGLALMLHYEPGMEAVAQASNGADAVALFR